VGNVTIGSAVTIAGFSTSSLPPSTVTVGNTVTIAGTVTANVPTNTNFPISYRDETGSQIVVNTIGQSLPVQVFSPNGDSALFQNPLPISGTVTVGNSVTIGSLPSISGTVTVGASSVTFNSHVAKRSDGSWQHLSVESGSNFVNARVYPPSSEVFSATVTIGNSVTISSLPVISGTVTVGGFSSVSVGSGAVLAAGLRSGAITPIPIDSGSGRVAGSTVVQYNVGGPTPYQDVTSSFPLPVQVVSQGSVTISSIPAISGTVTANLSSANLNTVTIGVRGTVTIGNSITISSIPSISGTVTANLSRPTWTNYSGSITTAGTAVTAISNTSRSYLLAQVTTGQLFLNIGATATTLNSVYFSAGQGFAWETVVPQGIVSVISTVTGTNYVLKEG